MLYKVKYKATGDIVVTVHGIRELRDTGNLLEAIDEKGIVQCSFNKKDFLSQEADNGHC